MRRTRFAAMNCSLARALDEIGDWWTLLVLREVAMGNSRFDAIGGALGIARNILSARLAKLVRHGILDRAPILPGARRQGYRLTAKGEALVPALVALMQWGDRWISGAAPMRVVDRRTGAAIPRIIMRGAAGKPVGVDGIRFSPGPGAEPRTIAHLARLETARDR